MSSVNVARNEKPMDVQTAVNLLRNFKMKFSPSGRSGGVPDLRMARQDKIVEALGPAAEAAIPALEITCKDKDKSIKVNARNALKSLKAKK